jgi:hypothetical protein
MSESAAEVSEAQRRAAAEVGRAVRRLGRRTPWTGNCLVRALAVNWMLKRRHIPCTVYFGLTRDCAGELKAHAWVRSGTQVLTGADGRGDFSVVATFAGPCPNHAAPR